MIIHLEMNELNMGLVQDYADEGLLPAFSGLLRNSEMVVTRAESQFALLEPWIQWPTIYSGMTQAEHGIFRLGDIVQTNHHQIFEKAEELTGGPVVALSPMNALNRLVHPKSIFLPDPWTSTQTKAGPLLTAFAALVKRAVNDNSKRRRLSIFDALLLVVVALRYAPVSCFPAIGRAVSLGLKKSWARPLILDSLLVAVLAGLCRERKPVLATVFLNGAAHLQHHYFYTSKHYSGPNTNPSWFVESGDDPLLEAYKVYDQSISLVTRLLPNATIMMSTGLSQVPNPREVHYYRPLDHEALVQLLGVDFYSSVEPRMSRDFLISFASANDLERAVKLMGASELQCSGEKLLQIDVRERSIFVKVAYHESPDQSLEFTALGKSFRFMDHFSHVTIENGVHQSKGYHFKVGENDPVTTQGKGELPLSSIFERLLDAVLVANKARS